VVVEPLVIFTSNVALPPPAQTFMIVRVACAVLVNVQVTISPASTLKVAVAVPTFPVLATALAESSQVIEFKTQPSFATSVEVY
jgi:hypothetical protein